MDTLFLFLFNTQTQAFTRATQPKRGSKKGGANNQRPATHDGSPAMCVLRTSGVPIGSNALVLQSKSFGKNILINVEDEKNIKKDGKNNTSGHGSSSLKKKMTHLGTCTHLNLCTTLACVPFSKSSNLLNFAPKKLLQLFHNGTPILVSCCTPLLHPLVSRTVPPSLVCVSLSHLALFSKGVLHRIQSHQRSCRTVSTAQDAGIASLRTKEQKQKQTITHGYNTWEPLSNTPRLA